MSEPDVAAVALTATNVATLEVRRAWGGATTRARAPSVSTVSSGGHTASHEEADAAGDAGRHRTPPPQKQQRHAGLPVTPASSPSRKRDSTLLATPSKPTPPPGSCWTRLTCAADATLSTMQAALVPLGALRVHMESESIKAAATGVIQIGGRASTAAPFATALVLFPSKRAVRDALQVLHEHPPSDPHVAALWSGPSPPTLSVVSLDTQSPAVLSHVDRSFTSASLDTSSRFNLSLGGVLPPSPNLRGHNQSVAAISATPSPPAPGTVEHRLDVYFGLSRVDDEAVREATFDILEATATAPAAIGRVVLPRLLSRLGGGNRAAVHLLSRLLVSGLLGPVADPFSVVVGVLSNPPTALTEGLLTDMQILCVALQVTSWSTTSVFAVQAAYGAAALSRNPSCPSRLAAHALHSQMMLLPAVAAHVRASQATLPLLGFTGGRAERKHRTVMVRLQANTTTTGALMGWVTRVAHAVPDRVRVCRLGKAATAPIAAFVECATLSDALALRQHQGDHHVEPAKQSIGDDTNAALDALFTATGACVRPAQFGSGAHASVTLASMLSSVA